jgi:hypothetical protein
MGSACRGQRVVVEKRVNIRGIQGVHASSDGECKASALLAAQFATRHWRLLFAQLEPAVPASPAVVHQRRPPRATHWHGARVKHSAERLECSAAPLADVSCEQPSGGVESWEFVWGLWFGIPEEHTPADPPRLGFAGNCRPQSTLQKKGFSVSEKVLSYFDRQSEIFMQVLKQKN